MKFLLRDDAVAALDATTETHDDTALLADVDTIASFDAMSVGLVIIRVIVGVTFAAHGYNKFFGGGKIAGTARWFDSMGMRPNGTIHAFLAASTELGGGLLFAVGLLTPLAAAGIVGVMFVAGWTVTGQGLLHRERAAGSTTWSWPPSPSGWPPSDPGSTRSTGSSGWSPPSTPTRPGRLGRPRHRRRHRPAGWPATGRRPPSRPTGDG